jgi:hypothetical protein
MRRLRTLLIRLRDTRSPHPDSVVDPEVTLRHE